MHTNALAETNVFEKMGIHWAEIADQNETPSQIQFLKKHIKKDDIILDSACGTGRHLIALNKLGYKVVGIDVSSNLLRIAKNRYHSAQLVRGDVKFLPFKVAGFSAVISMDTSFGYLNSEEEDQQSLTEIARVLSYGGFIVIDVFNPEHLIRNYSRLNFLKRVKRILLPLLLILRSRCLLLRAFKWRQYPSFFLHQRRAIFRRGHLLKDLWIIMEKTTGKVTVYNHNVRLYNKMELQTFLNNAGFNIKAVYGGYDDKEFGSDLPRLILLAIGQRNATINP
jgi:SAM-dependent methyltransferase